MKAKTPNLKFWWFVLNNSKKRRWLVKNLKQFVSENNYYTQGRWYDWDVRNLYSNLLLYGRTSQWVTSKPTVKQIINVIGSNLPAGYYCKELPYHAGEFRDCIDLGISKYTKDFWNDIDFNI